jgi:hypothetical protein
VAARDPTAVNSPAPSGTSPAICSFLPACLSLSANDNRGLFRWRKYHGTQKMQRKLAAARATYGQMSHGSRMTPERASEMAALMASGRQRGLVLRMKQLTVEKNNGVDEGLHSRRCASVRELV